MKCIEKGCQLLHQHPQDLSQSVSVSFKNFFTFTFHTTSEFMQELNSIVQLKDPVIKIQNDFGYRQYTCNDVLWNYP